MPSSLDSFCKTLTSSRIKNLLLIFSTLCNLCLLISLNRIQSVQILTKPIQSSPTSPHHLVFGIASSSKTWIKRTNYVRHWWKPHQLRGFVFLDRQISDNNTYNLHDSLPPVLISENTSRFPYTYKSGLRSAIRVARIVKEIADLNLTDVRWFVFGDDDTVFFVENLVKTLSKYDHNLWYYIGSNSESFEQNSKYSFDMAFGGGGFAISYPLARVLAVSFDSCLMRYSHVYGSDSRVFSCLVELGVRLTHEPGFHQVDIRGDLFGMLSAHPLAPLLSLHHLDYMEPIFPNMNRTQALEHLFGAVKVDPERILQHIVCYDHSKLWTISISWGYAVQVVESNKLLPDLLALQRTFMPWKRSANSGQYMFNTRESPKNQCERPTLFFLESVFSDTDRITSNYNRYSFKNCSRRSSSKNLELVRVFSQKLELDVGKLQAPRRHCCDVLPSSFGKRLDIGIRECRNEELISMKSYLLHAAFEINANGAQFAVKCELNASLKLHRPFLMLLQKKRESELSVLSGQDDILEDHLSQQSSGYLQVNASIAFNTKTWPRRMEHVKLWWKPNQTRGCVFLEKMPSLNDTETLPPVCISGDTSHFRYTHRGGHRSAIRIARVVLETVSLNHSDVRWFVFGDDDTLFFTENLVKTLSKYDHNQWYYIGANSESFVQNKYFSFEMGYGGGGFAISYPLAKVLAKVLDSCLTRYPHLYGSDSMIFSCLAELGVGLTHESGFHQVDVRGDLFGLLAAHPLAPLVSLHHLDYVEPIFPNKTRNQALKHLLKAYNFDPQRILQKTVCYDKRFSWTISISWGYAVQVFERNVLLPNLLSVQQTFKPWNNRFILFSEFYMFNTRKLHYDPCKRPAIFFLDSLTSSNTDGIESIYSRSISENCLLRNGSSKTLEKIRVYSHNLDLDIKQLQAPRRHCCEVIPSSDGNVLDIAIRECGEEEITFMHLFDHILWSTKSKFVNVSSQTSLDHVVFGIASSFKSWPKRKEYVRLWWKPEQMRGCVFLDKSIPAQNDNNTLPPICISGDTSRFPYSFRGGDRSAIRVARVVLETVWLNHSDVRWFVFGDDDTVFFPENLVKTLSKYDHNQWYYIGSISETFIQNDNDLSSFEMGYGGGGFALSYPLAKVLAKVLDSSLERHPHLYGSDARIYSCLAELGVGLTHESGFHQVDIRGDLFGLLAAHPLAPLLSLHHMDYVDPIFPNKNRIQALQHLFEALAFDPLRILQQTVCYNKQYSWTISISWGYAVQVFETNVLLRDLLPVQKTFKLWRQREIPNSNLYMFNTRELPSDPCQRPTIFFLDSLSSSNTDDQMTKSIYRRNIPANCLEKKGSSKTLEEIRVFSHKLNLEIKQVIKYY
ncbi:Protein of unknown function DUF604 [Macleaya cordata]|uniref:Uncharacterized protein n=1 Tax=Macleaya cordata TaxID=56857 RepID=A0A200QK66_MACCD|nr:Protein of unknown function DUF604 [Macleaya cordata]